MAAAQVIASPQPERRSAASPSLSPSSEPRKRVRSNSDEEAFFLLSGAESSSLRAKVDASIGPDMKRRMMCSLQETLAGVRDEYPAEMQANDLAGARRRATSDLSDLACRLSTPGSFATPAASPTVGAQLPPLDLPPLRETSEAAIDTTGFLEHDGLLDHEMLMQAIYASQGLDLSAVQSQAHQFLKDMGLRPHDLGVMNTDESGQVMINQCFYLSIAHSYLGLESTPESVSALALRLKRAVETAVLAVRPGWAMEDSSGSEAMAFADFLPIAMAAGKEDDADGGGEEDGVRAVAKRPGANLTAELAVCILDSVQGHVEVFLGPRYASMDVETRERNLILLWYTPGHYQCIVRDDADGSKVSMTYEAFKDILTKNGVMYIETTE
eukprot:TRINITY_DN20481_c0_g1_i1.p1 TRINITY_DN20481_c0_g1~~TRINITY_DN20481_c0_g1_i1.p1  ORF type:complete len:420 (+),score=108.51 TRINITY_DN20481_c0_g1_i1:110-1261(+)